MIRLTRSLSACSPRRLWRAGILSLAAILTLCGSSMARGGAPGGEEKPDKERIAALECRLEQQAAEIERLRTEQQRLLERLNALLSASAAAAGTAGAPSVLPAKMVVGGGEAALPAPVISAGSQPAPEQVTNAAPNPSRRKEGHKDARLELSGYGSFRFEANNVGGNQLIPGGSGKAFTMRRFVLSTTSRLSDRIQIHSEMEFERLLELALEKSAVRSLGGLRLAQGFEGNNGAEIGLEQLWAQYELGRGQHIRAGLILPPLGRFNILHDDDYWDIPRRTLTDRDAPVLPVPVAWRELGVGLVGSLGLKSSARLDYQVYVTGGSTLDFNFQHVGQTRAGDTTLRSLEAELRLAGGAADGTKNAGTVAWRVALSPTLGTEIAFSGYHAKYSPSFLPVAGRVNAFGVDGKWRRGAWEIEGESIWTLFGNANGVASSLAATALHSSSAGEAGNVETKFEIELGNLARRRYGFWTDLKYHWRPAFLRKSFLGRGFEDAQLIPIVRYERVWLRDSIQALNFSGGAITSVQTAHREQDRLTLGVNYRPVQALGVQLGYEHNQRRRGPGIIFPRVPLNSSDGFLMGLTFSF